MADMWMRQYFSTRLQSARCCLNSRGCFARAAGVGEARARALRTPPCQDFLLRRKKYSSRGFKPAIFFRKGHQAIFAFSSYTKHHLSYSYRPQAFHSLSHGYRKEGGHSPRATGQGWQRWHGKHQSQGRELLPVGKARKAAEHLEGGQGRAQRCW